MTDLLTRLKAQPLFQNLPPRFLNDLMQVASECAWPGGHMLFHQGEPAKVFYLIKSGVVALEIFAADKGLIRLQTLHGGDLLGWSWLFAPYEWHFDAHVLEDSEAIVFNAQPFLALCEADHELGYQMMRRFAQLMIERLQSARLQILDINGGSRS